MRIGEICSRDVLTAEPSDALAKCAKAMGERNVGSVVVVDRSGGFARPIGILTDRDILRGQFDRHSDLYCLNAGDVMTANPLVLKEDCDVRNAIDCMGQRAVRRVPVVDSGGELVGIVTFDDLLPAIAGQIAAIAGLVSQQIENRRVRS